MGDEASLVARLREKAASYEAKAASLYAAADVVEAEVGTTRPDTQQPQALPARVSSTGLALEVINSDDRHWTVNEIMDAMLARGWQTNAANVLNTTRTAVSRLAAQGAIRRVGNGLYQRNPTMVVPDGEHEPDDESEGANPEPWEEAHLR